MVRKIALLKMFCMMTNFNHLLSWKYQLTNTFFFIILSYFGWNDYFLIIMPMYVNVDTIVYIWHSYYTYGRSLKVVTLSLDCRLAEYDLTLFLEINIIYDIFSFWHLQVEFVMKMMQSCVKRMVWKIGTTKLVTWMKGMDDNDHDKFSFNVL